MSVLLQISDPHFGTEQPPVVEALAALALRQRPDLLVLSGDITQRARRDEFRAARAFVDRLGAPLLAIPGNHDIPLFDLRARLFHPYARHCEAFGDDIEPEHASRELLVLCVNTTRRWRHKNGQVSTRQIERVAERLSRAGANQLRVVVVHQPVAVLRDEDVHDRLRNHAAAQVRWAAAGADLVMGGHIHLPYVMALHEPQQHAARDTRATLATRATLVTRAMWAVQAGTSVSARVRRGVPNSVNIVRWGVDAPTGRCVIEQWDYVAREQAFVRATVTDVKPAREAHVA